jgi:hypothetical protein
MADFETDPDVITRKFREDLVNAGIVTPEQSLAVGFKKADPMKHQDIPRCQCDRCRTGNHFMMFYIEEGKLSLLQIRAIILMYNRICAPHVAMPDDLGKLRRGQIPN